MILNAPWWKRNCRNGQISKRQTNFSSKREREWQAKLPVPARETEPMALLYRIRCDECKCSPNPDEDGPPYILRDGDEKGLILPHGYTGLLLDSGKFEPLPHPCERYRLAELGFNW